MILRQIIDFKDAKHEIALPFGMVLSDSNLHGFTSMSVPYANADTRNNISTWCTKSVNRITNPSTIGSYFDPVLFDRRINAVLDTYPNSNPNDRTLFILLNTMKYKYSGHLIQVVHIPDTPHVDLFVMLRPSNALNIIEFLNSGKDGKVYHRIPSSCKMILFYRVDLERFLRFVKLLPRSLEHLVPEQLRSYEETIKKISFI